MMRGTRLLAGTLALAAGPWGLWAAETSDAELKVLSAGGMHAVLQELVPAFEAASGHKLKIEYASAEAVEKKVAAGR
jgi:ABC-type molybdate transport system substrate-binding protein